MQLQDSTSSCTLSPIPTPCPTSLILLVHGLNNTPAVFDDLLQASPELAERSVLLTLKGHGSSLDHKLAATDWLSDIQCAEQELLRSCPDSQLNVISYSVGGLAVLTYLRESPSQFSRLLFIAPALSTSIISLPLRLFTPLAALHLSLPSLAPEHIRAHSHTPLAYYRALFALQDSLVTGSNPLIDIEASVCVALNPNDQLVDQTEVLQYFTQWKADTYQYITLPATRAPYGHLVVERESYTEASWQSVVHSVEHCLE